jgi:hypothetical protein
MPFLVPSQSLGDLSTNVEIAGGARDYDWNSVHKGSRGLRKDAIECSRKPTGCTLDDHGDQKVERETGVDLPGAKPRVEFVYRIEAANPNQRRPQDSLIDLSPDKT